MPTPSGSGRPAEMFRNPAAFIIAAISRAEYARPPPVAATMWTEKKTGPGGEMPCCQIAAVALLITYFEGIAIYLSGEDSRPFWKAAVSQYRIVT